MVMGFFSSSVVLTGSSSIWFGFFCFFGLDLDMEDGVRCIYCGRDRGGGGWSCVRGGGGWMQVRSLSDCCEALGRAFGDPLCWLVGLDMSLAFNGNKSVGH